MSNALLMELLHRGKLLHAAAYHARPSTLDQRENITALRLGVFVIQMLLWVLAPIAFCPNLRSWDQSTLVLFLLPVRVT